MTINISLQEIREAGFNINQSMLNSIVSDAWDEAVRRTGVLKSKEYIAFQRKYFHDPAGFVRDCFLWDKSRGESPADYQIEMLNNLVKIGRLAVHGPHGLGKSTTSAWLILWFALTRDGLDWKIPTLASKWRQLTHYLWPEVHKWVRRLDWKKIGRDPFDERNELFNMLLKLDTGRAFPMATKDPTAVEGAHAVHMLYIFDESKTIPGALFDAAEGAFSGAGAGGEEALALAVSTPGNNSGRFYDICSKAEGYEDWGTMHVTLEMAIAAGRIGKDWAEKRKRQWGAASPIYINRVLGKFAPNSTNGVISIELVEQANENWEEWANRGKSGTLTHIGVDVGRGGNESVVSLIYDNTIVGELRKNSVDNIMHTTGVVAGIMRANPSAIAVVDVIGIGAGVVDRLREMFPVKRVVAFNAGLPTKVTDKTGEIGFLNKRSASWWLMREALEKGDVILPPDPFLQVELTTPTFSLKSTGRIYVEAKEEVIKRIDKSTDSADSVIMGIIGEKLASEFSGWAKGMAA